MTPERKEQMKAAFEMYGSLGGESIKELLAALEEAEKPDIKSINKIKKLEVDLQSALAVNQKYLGDIERISSELAEAQQTIARQREALENAKGSFETLALLTNTQDIKIVSHNAIVCLEKSLEEGEAQP
ncbi:hypothetical protein [Paenibacillus graminis]|uniref:Uncharacterized protein n=1 Tax=Paenibacillus graminis TaxID=189425 RepID=A0A089MAT8_9BACL|nr:hypothetical protein [Paenibacillus graminis]AIQ70382.1 hypothetical protein PGRAT_24175 [Paenibacillus graminis]